jgi:hypothetical protein
MAVEALLPVAEAFIPFPVALIPSMEAFNAVATAFIPSMTAFIPSATAFIPSMTAFTASPTALIRSATALMESAKGRNASTQVLGYSAAETRRPEVAPKETGRPRPAQKLAPPKPCVQLPQMRAIILMLIVLASIASAEEKDTLRQSKKQDERMAAKLAVEIARAELLRMQDVYDIWDRDMDAPGVMVSCPSKYGQFLLRYSETKKQYLRCAAALDKLEERSVRDR